jgi:hypothetical protein
MSAQTSQLITGTGMITTMATVMIINIHLARTSTHQQKRR